MADQRVIVIGGGLAGLSATMKLAELGKHDKALAIFDKLLLFLLLVIFFFENNQVPLPL